MDVPKKQTCPQCRKSIDAHARICLFCNFRIRARDGHASQTLKFPPPAPQNAPLPDKVDIAPAQRVEEDPPQLRSVVAPSSAPEVDPAAVARRTHVRLSLADEDVPDMPADDEDSRAADTNPRPRFTLTPAAPHAPELISLSERLRQSTLLRVAMIAALMIGGFATGKLAVRSLMKSSDDPAPTRIAEISQPVVRAERVNPAIESAESDVASTAPAAVLGTRTQRSEASIVSPSLVPAAEREAPVAERATSSEPRTRRSSRSLEKGVDEVDEVAEPIARSRRQGRRTRAVPILQPLPEVSSSRRGTVRLELLVGADGRVKEITVVRAVSGVTSQIIAAVQEWEFRPAMLDGKPVAESFDVVLSF